MPYLKPNFWRIPHLEKGFYHTQMMDFIIGHIHKGTLPVHTTLPTYRSLAEENGLHRNTVMRSLKKLQDMGYLASKPGAVMFVSPTYPGHQKYERVRKLPLLPLRLPNLRLSQEKYIIPKHNFLSIGFDTPSPGFFPYKLYRKYARGLAKGFLTESQMQLLIDLKGDEYKNAVLDYVNVIRGFRLPPDSMHILMGRQSTLTAVFQSLLISGDGVVNTAPMDPILSNILAKLQLKSISLSTADPNFISKLIKCLKTNPVKALYVRPQCGYPEGNHLDAKTAKKLIVLAEQYSFYIVEEEEEHEFWYEKVPFKPLFSYKHNGYVIYMGPLSMLVPYMHQTRVIAAASEFINRIKEMQFPPFEARDLLEEKVIIEMLKSGEFYEHLRKVRKTIAEEHFVQIKWEMGNYLGPFVEISDPSGGLTLWLKWKTDKDLQEDMHTLMAAGYQIPFMEWSPMPGNGIKQIRLGFGSWDIQEAQGPAKMIHDKHIQPS